ncbi:hypothetical protein BOS5A_210609 [Bosea sp. EC-HK365B]|nr:hypothetical protein BOSE7B_120470 [Bosea sp. 7B]CAD5278116.1 hypothetical protein BOSE46_40090 [Bosea sp. 46]VVT59818.1 hypothetical protein BOS5A_210609 [Bosea sp. EC-HK365B]VXC76156.1 hypothetical protein BOSE125_50090 [Bosea sp. 125]
MSEARWPRDQVNDLPIHLERAFIVAEAADGSTELLNIAEHLPDGGEAYIAAFKHRIWLNTVASHLRCFLGRERQKNVRPGVHFAPKNKNVRRYPEDLSHSDRAIPRERHSSGCPA